MSTKTEEKKERRKRRQRKRYALAGVFIVVFLVASVLIEKQFQLRGRLDAILSKNAKRLGANDAPVTIVEYSDFQCTVCRNAQPILKELMSKYAGKIQLEFRHFPLTTHQWAVLAHQAAECANQAGYFWEYHDLLYENQSTWAGTSNPSGQLVQYANDLGLDMSEFTTCLQDGGVRNIIMKDRNGGNVQQVSSTPTFFVNNKRIVGVTNLKKKMELEIQSILGKNAGK